LENQCVDGHRAYAAWVVACIDDDGSIFDPVCFDEFRTANRTNDNINLR
jgi:hypothetical protein